MDNQEKVVGTVFEVVSVSGRKIIYVELESDATFKEGDEIEITLTKKDDES